MLGPPAPLNWRNKSWTRPFTRSPSCSCVHTAPHTHEDTESFLCTITVGPDCTTKDINTSEGLQPQYQATESCAGSAGAHRVDHGVEGSAATCSAQQKCVVRGSFEV
jgi:hypothetical protein